jgi:proline iminopeptidase
MKFKYLLAFVCTMLSVLPIGSSAASSYSELSSRMDPGEHLAKLDGIVLHYEIRGKGPLVVVQAPGWGIGSEYLKKGLEPLEKRFTVLTYDPRGTGLSSPVDSTEHLTNNDLANDLEQLRIYLGLNQLDLVGHSNGSAIAILYAEEHPNHVRKLVAIGSQLLGYRGAAGPAETAEDTRRRMNPQFATYSAIMREPTPATDAAFTQQFKAYAGFFFYEPAKGLPVLLSSMTKPMSVSMNKAFEESPLPAEAPPVSDLGKITASTLIVEGRQDPACSLSESEQIQQGVHGSRLVPIDHAGHFPWIEQPEQFFGSVTAFLE